jgi:chromosomal replication initiator protein
LAEHITSNIRELEGAINILITHQQLLWQTLTIAHAQQALHTIGIKPPVSTTSPAPQEMQATQPETVWWSQQDQVETLLQQVANHFGIEVKAICGQGRTKEVSQARQVAMYLIKTKYGRSLQRIGDYFGGRNHASVIYAIQICEQEIQRQPQLRKFVQGI